MAVLGQGSAGKGFAGDKTRTAVELGMQQGGGGGYRDRGRAGTRAQGGKNLPQGKNSRTGKSQIPNADWSRELFLSEKISH